MIVSRKSVIVARPSRLRRKRAMALPCEAQAAGA
jgi:hypothetical protein